MSFANGYYTFNNLGQRIRKPPCLGTNHKSRGEQGGALACEGDWIKKLLRSEDIRANKKDAT